MGQNPETTLCRARFLAPKVVPVQRPTRLLRETADFRVCTNYAKKNFQP